MNQLLPQLRLRNRPRTASNDGRSPRLAPPRPTPDGTAPTRPGLPRRLIQPLPLVGLALLVIAAIGYAAVAAGSHSTKSEVVVAARSLPAGTRLNGSDLRLVKLSAGSALLDQLVPGTAEQSLLGHRLSAPVLAGLPIGKASVAAAGGGPAAFTLAVPYLHALGGNLTVGDHVSVLVTFTGQSGSSIARVIARGLVVLAVGQPGAGIDANSATTPVTVALPDPSLASELALANSVGKIDLLRDGNNTTAVMPSAATSTASGATP